MEFIPGASQFFLRLLYLGLQVGDVHFDLLFLALNCSFSVLDSPLAPAGVGEEFIVELSY